MSLLAALQKKKQELAAKGGRAKTVKLPNGSSRWRILPHWAGKDEVPSQDFGAHFIKNAAGEIVAVYVCTLRTFGRDCEICTKLGEAMASADPDQKVVLEEARSAQRYLLNAVKFNPTTKKYDDQVSLLEVAAPVINGITSVAINYAESDEIDIFDLAQGVDVVIAREGTGIGTKYNVMAAPKATPIDAGYMQKLNNLDEYVAQEHEAGKAKALAAIGGGNNVPQIAAPRNVTPAGALPAAVAGKAAIEGTAKVVASAPANDDVEDALSDLDLSDVDFDGLDNVGN